MKFGRMLKKLIAILLTAVLLGSMIVAVFGQRVTSLAIFDKSTAVTYQTYSSGNTIENSVLFIGTYIIHKDALNDQLYEKAQKSASESSQNDLTDSGLT